MFVVPGPLPVKNRYISRNWGGGCGVVLQDAHEAVRIAVLDEAHLLRLKLRARADVAVYEDDRIVVGARPRVRRRAEAEQRDHGEHHGRGRAQTRAPYP